jgi:Peptidase S46
LKLFDFFRKALPLALLPAAALAAEGMWPLDQLPMAQMQARYGFAPDAAWVNKAMRASARLAGGCSASFVSPDGLVLTNHHCITRCIQALSGPGNDRMAAGFLARERREELRCPDFEVNRLDAISDVTAQVRAATAGQEGAAYQAAEDAARARLTRECRGNDAEHTRCDMVTLYRGGQHQIYKYRRYADVRLVWAPEAAAAAFGGDPDNFNFPRWALDASFLRVYEGGKPAAVQEHFKFRPEGAQPGELVLVTGHPGATQRLLTVAQLETERDTLALHTMPRLSEQRGVMLQLARGDAEQRRLAMAALQGIENGLKVTRGRLQALGEGTLMENKRRAEAALQAFVASQPELAARTGKPWAEIEAAQRIKREMEAEYQLLEGGNALLSAHFAYARTLVRGAAERSKPNAERLREFNDTSLPQIEQRLRAVVPVYPDFEQVRLAWSLNRFRSLLGPDDAAVKQVLGPRSPEEVAAALLAGTRLGDAAERMRLWAGGQAAINASDDSFIRLARALEPTALALRARYEAQVLAVERRAATRIAQAQFVQAAQAGKALYPDATFSLRLSYGEVAGWQEKGRAVPPYTDIASAFGRHSGVAPFALPASWMDAKPRLNPAQRYNFVATQDIIGGNSGSPMLDRQGRVVGLAFDGNIHSLGGAYSYDESQNRTVGVHAGAIVEALRQVYRADALVQELMGAAAAP